MIPVTEQYLQLRTAVAFLGQQDGMAWWSTSFLTPNGVAYLDYNFPRAPAFAALNATATAAKRFHDERIGRRRCNHLFRLTMADEIVLQRTLLASASKAAELIPSSKEDAMARIQKLARGKAVPQAGPTRVGETPAAFTSEGVQLLAAHYLAGFEQGIACLPYFSSDRA